MLKTILSNQATATAIIVQTKPPTNSTPKSSLESNYILDGGEEVGKAQGANQDRKALRMYMKDDRTMLGESQARTQSRVVPQTTRAEKSCKTCQWYLQCTWIMMMYATEYGAK